MQQFFKYDAFGFEMTRLIKSKIKLYTMRTFSVEWKVWWSRLGFAININVLQPSHTIRKKLISKSNLVRFNLLWKLAVTAIKVITITISKSSSILEVKVARIDNHSQCTKVIRIVRTHNDCFWVLRFSVPTVHVQFYHTSSENVAIVNIGSVYVCLWG